jgi:DNA-binding response OmpR family regulator
MLFVFAHYLDLERCLLLFDAGVDDCVSEPFFASELTVRLGLSIGLRQAASSLWACREPTVLISGDLKLDLVPAKNDTIGKDD